jgi:hypothetical protein
VVSYVLGSTWYTLHRVLYVLKADQQPILFLTIFQGHTLEVRNMASNDLTLEHRPCTNTRAMPRQAFRANDPALTETWEEQTDTAPVEDLALVARRSAWKETIRHFSPS